MFEGVYTTLTIGEVTAADMFGRYRIYPTNTEGQGVLHLDLVGEFLTFRQHSREMKQNAAIFFRTKD